MRICRRNALDESACRARSGASCIDVVEGSGTSVRVPCLFTQALETPDSWLSLDCGSCSLLAGWVAERPLDRARVPSSKRQTITASEMLEQDATERRTRFATHLASLLRGASSTPPAPILHPILEAAPVVVGRPGKGGRKRCPVRNTVEGVLNELDARYGPGKELRKHRHILRYFEIDPEGDGALMARLSGTTSVPARRSPCISMCSTPWRNGSDYARAGSSSSSTPTATSPMRSAGDHPRAGHQAALGDG